MDECRLRNRLSELTPQYTPDGGILCCASCLRHIRFRIQLLESILGVQSSASSPDSSIPEILDNLNLVSQARFGAGGDGYVFIRPTRAGDALTAPTAIDNSDVSRTNLTSLELSLFLTRQNCRASQLSNVAFVTVPPPAEAAPPSPPPSDAVPRTGHMQVIATVR